jgi:hypothetical protein
MSICVIISEEPVRIHDKEHEYTDMYSFMVL